MSENGSIQPLTEKSVRAIQFKLAVYLLGEGSELILFWATLAKFWSSSGHKMAETRGFRPLCEKCSCNSIQNWGAHLLGTCWELIRFWVTLAKFWPSSGQKITENGFRSLSQKYSSNTFKLGVYTYPVSVQHWFAFRPHWRNDWKWWFPIIIWKMIHAIQFKLGVYSYWVSVQNWLAFGLLRSEGSQGVL